jgi:hypothetical protein
VTLRPGSRPAQLLLTLLQAKDQGRRSSPVEAGPGRERLISQGLIQAASTDDVGEWYALTQTGHDTARTLEMSR